MQAAPYREASLAEEHARSTVRFEFVLGAVHGVFLFLALGGGAVLTTGDIAFGTTPDFRSIGWIVAFATPSLLTVVGVTRRGRARRFLLLPGLIWPALVVCWATQRILAARANVQSDSALWLLPLFVGTATLAMVTLVAYFRLRPQGA